MDELAADSLTRSSISCDSEYNLYPVNSPEDQEYTKEEDNRIVCSNNRGLDLINRIVSSHVTQFASSLDLGEEQSQFTSRVLEIFKDTIQENVTINGLPYVADKNFLSAAGTSMPAGIEILTNEGKEALLSNLSKKVQDVSAKRKRFPKEYTRIYQMRLHHEYQNLKKGTVEPKVNLPSVSKESFQIDSLSSQKFEETIGRIKSSQKKLLDTVKELKEMEKNIEYAQKVAVNQESFCDTGYISS